MTSREEWIVYYVFFATKKYMENGFETKAIRAPEEQLGVIVDDVRDHLKEMDGIDKTKP